VVREDEVVATGAAAADSGMVDAKVSVVARAEAGEVAREGTEVGSAAG